MKYDAYHCWIFSVLTIVVFSFGGCSIEVEETPDQLADLEVEWRLNGSTSPSLCSRYNIDTWVIQARGPEFVQAELSCDDNFWNSAADFYNLIEGSYTVSVDALSPSGRLLVGQDARVRLRSDDTVDVLQFDFYREDFV